MGCSGQDWPFGSCPGLEPRIAVALWLLDWKMTGHPASAEASVALGTMGNERPGSLWVWVRAGEASVEDCRRWGSGNGRGLSDWTSSGSDIRQQASS